MRLDPFKGQDLATVDATTLKNIETMRKAAESAETKNFNPAIKAASGAAAKGFGYDILFCVLIVGLG